jgi:SAM-dependent methyltransferase
MSDDFYRAFEERHRGSRELIKSRQRVYLPFIEPLLFFCEGAKAIDLGCGRGEWLELLTESGFDAHGVDLDDGMLEACRELGLNVATKDVISALKELPDESQIIVSGFHIAEHIDFFDLQLLVQDALRVLKPGGLLILETPNPENITVGTVNFYLDPTHQRPLPPQLLAFLPEYYGFFRVKLMRLQEDKALAVRERISLHDVLGGVSPDYAVVAQKSAEGSLRACNSDAFAKEYGLTLDALVWKFDQQAMQASERAASAEAQAHQASERAASAEAQAHQASERAASAEAQAHQASERAASAEAQAQQASERAASAEAQAQQASERAASAEAQAQQASERAASAEAQAQQASERAANAESALISVHNSSSWRLTAPLRMASRAASAFSQGPKALKPAIKTKTKLLLAHASLYVNRRPKLRQAALGVLARFPTLKARLKVATMNRYFAQTTVPTVSTDLANLTPRARQIYADLRAAIENNKRNG